MNGADRTVRALFEKYFGAGTDELDTVLDKLRVIELEGGQWLCRQGDAGGSLFFLVRGRLEVWMTPEGAAEGAPATRLGEIVPGRSVGEISLLTGAPRTAGVRAIRQSQLFEVGRDEFESLARIHPAVVMMLAGRVASVLRDRTARVAPASKRFRTISLVPFGETPRVREFAGRLVQALVGYGRTLAVSADNLDSLGAPARLEAGGSIPAALREWLHDQENAYRFVLYECEPAATPWSIYAMQQSDLVVYVAEAASSPEPSAGETGLVNATGTANARRMLVLLQEDSKSPITGTSRWLAGRELDLHLHVRSDCSDELERVARIVSGNGLGLVLAAGAARGFAHLGVFKALSEAGIRPDWIGGASMGAVMGACIAKGWDPDKAIATVRDAFANSNPFGDFTLPLMALLRGRRLERMLEKYLPGCIEDLPIPMYAISCNLDDGSVNVHERGLLPDALRASTSMPGVMPPAVVEGQLALDGAVINNMPVDVMQTKPVGRIVAVDLSSQRKYTVPYTRMPSPWAVLRGRFLPFTRKYRVPTLMTLTLKATEIGTMSRVREMGRRADLLLVPPVREFGMMDIKAFDRIVDAGYRYGREAIAEWQARSGHALRSPEASRAADAVSAPAGH